MDQGAPASAPPGPSLSPAVLVATGCRWPVGPEQLPGAVGRCLGSYMATEAGLFVTNLELLSGKHHPELTMDQ